MPSGHGLSTRCIHAGEAPDPSTGAHGVPLYANVTYAFRSFDQLEGMRDGTVPHFTYAPRGNPTVRSFELKMADLEGAEWAAAGASGMSVITATMLTLLAGGGHAVAPAEMYELAKTFFAENLAALGASVTFVDIGDLDAVAAAFTPQTRLLYAEPLANPSLRVADLPALAALAERHRVPLVVDNTFLSPALFRPLEHGATLALHSATKYIAGHGQAQGGVVAGPRALVARIAETMIRLGGAMPPFHAWMLLAGIKTLPLRMERHALNAARLARLLAGHPAVAAVAYPGLPSHPGHDRARRLLGEGDERFGGMLSFTLRGGQPARRAFVNGLRLATVAVSLGDVGTLVWPWATGDLIRVSVGLEDAADLEADFAAGLAAASAVLESNRRPG